MKKSHVWQIIVDFSRFSDKIQLKLKKFDSEIDIFWKNVSWTIITFPSQIFFSLSWNSDFPGSPNVEPRPAFRSLLPSDDAPIPVRSPIRQQHQHGPVLLPILILRPIRLPGLSRNPWFLCPMRHSSWLLPGGNAEMADRRSRRSGSVPRGCRVGRNVVQHGVGYFGKIGYWCWTTGHLSSSLAHWQGEFKNTSNKDFQRQFHNSKSWKSYFEKSQFQKFLKIFRKEKESDGWSLPVSLFSKSFHISVYHLLIWISVSKSPFFELLYLLNLCCGSSDSPEFRFRFLIGAVPVDSFPSITHLVSISLLLSVQKPAISAINTHVSWRFSGHINTLPNTTGHWGKQRGNWKRRGCTTRKRRSWYDKAIRGFESMRTSSLSLLGYWIKSQENLKTLKQKKNNL